MQAEPKTLGSRVRLLIDRYWRGSVNYAAGDLGVPQPTLNRIASGRTSNPRIAVIVQIADRCSVSSEWLLTGKGPPPLERDDRNVRLDAVVFRWRRILSDLTLPDDVREALNCIPFEGFRLAEDVDLDVRGRSDHGFDSAISEFTSASISAWATLLEALAERYGARRVGAALRKSRVRLALGFGTVGGELVSTPDGDALGDMAYRLRADFLAKLKAHGVLATKQRADGGPDGRAEARAPAIEVTPTGTKSRPKQIRRRK